MSFLDNSSLCKTCGNKYTNIDYKWCKPCQINYLKENFTSGNEKIDNLIQEMQSKIDSYYDIVFEWIPYNQFDYIKKIGKGGFDTIYSAIWKDGPLYYNNNKYEYTRNQNTEVALKCLYNSQNITDEILNEILNIYGISQDPDTKGYVMVLQDGLCYNCGEEYTDIDHKWCKLCQLNYFKKNFTNWTSGDKKIDNLIQEMQLKIDSYYDIVFEWIPYSQFNDIKEIGEGGFATIYLAIWKDGQLRYDKNKNEYKRNSSTKVALKCLHDSQNITNEFLNEVKAYSISNYERTKILNVYGISQNPDTKNYIMILDYAEGGDFINWINNWINNYNDFDWFTKVSLLTDIIGGLKEIHQNQMIHRDFHTKNILFKYFNSNRLHISDMGLCGKVDDIDKTNIYGVMPYVAPEVLKGNPYTQAADIYSFGMVMYFVATERQPFADCAHDQVLVLSICNGIRPEINESAVPKCYIDLIKRCWDSNPDSRPNATEIERSIQLFNRLLNKVYVTKKENKEQQHYEIEKQFKEAEEYRKSHLTSFEENRQLSELTTHSQAFYTSRLLNPFTKYLPKYDNIDNNSVDITDFTKLSI